MQELFLSFHIRVERQPNGTLTQPAHILCQGKILSTPHSARNKNVVVPSCSSWPLMQLACLIQSFKIEKSKEAAL